MVIYWKWREILDTISTSTGAARPPVLIKGALYGIVVGLYVYKEWGKYSGQDTNNKAFWYQQFYVCQWAMSGFFFFKIQAVTILLRPDWGGYYLAI